MNRPKQDNIEYIFNLHLTKILGLYQILNPRDVFKIFGYNVFHVFVVLIGLPMIIISMLSPVGLYNLRNDKIITFILYFGYVNNFLFSCYKTVLILYHSKDIWKCVSVTRCDFMSYQHYNRNVLVNWQKPFVRVICTYISIYLIVFFIWTMSPCVLNIKTFKDMNLGGTNNNGIRSNIFNMYLLASGETYKNYFNIFYLIEISLCFGYLYFSILFDILTTVVCFGLSCQLESISDAIQSLGHTKPLSNNCSTYSFYIM